MKKLVYKLRSLCWNHTETFNNYVICIWTIIWIIVFLGIFVSFATDKISLIHFGINSFNIGIIITIPLVYLSFSETSLFMKPRQGYVLYDNYKHKDHYCFGKNKDYHELDEKDIYVILYCKRNVVFYSGGGRTCIYKSQLDTFLRKHDFVQLKTDKEVRCLKLNYNELNKIARYL